MKKETEDKLIELAQQYINYADRNNYSNWKYLYDVDFIVGIYSSEDKPSRVHFESNVVFFIYIDPKKIIISGNLSNGSLENLISEAEKLLQKLITREKNTELSKKKNKN